MAVPTILIAEDSSVILNLTKKILENQKYAVVLAKNGAEVMRQVMSQHLDGILMDINIPVQNGLECTRQIRAHSDPRIASIPIIAVTGNADNYSEEDFRAAGVNAYLPKPLDFDRLVKTVRELF
ncbi:MAG: response regulator [Hymenobacteraceae bacterium]|nr:response regulator [Hymenobacteraceae bacterium]